MHVACDKLVQYGKISLVHFYENRAVNCFRHMIRQDYRDDLDKLTFNKIEEASIEEWPIGPKSTQTRIAS